MSCTQILSYPRIDRHRLLHLCNDLFFRQTIGSIGVSIGFDYVLCSSVHVAQSVSMMRTQYTQDIFSLSDLMQNGRITFLQRRFLPVIYFSGLSCQSLNDVSHLFHVFGRYEVRGSMTERWSSNSHEIWRKRAPYM